MSVQDIEQAISALDRVMLRHIYRFVGARLQSEEAEDQPVPYERIAHLAGVFDDAPTDLSSNKRYLEGLGQSSVV